MSRAERILARIDKEAEEKEAARLKRAPERELRFKEIDALLEKYDWERAKDPYVYPDDARNTWRIIMERYQFDLVEFYKQVRKGRVP